MSGEFLGFALFLAAWWLLQVVVLPRFGVPT
jgi:predicted secreted protein